MSGSTLSQIAAKYNPKNKKMENYLNRATQLKINSLETNTIAHLKSNIARDTIFPKHMKNNAILLQCIFQMTDMIPKKSYSKISTDTLRDLGCGRFIVNDEGNYEHRFEYLYSNIQEHIGNRKLIFIMFGMEEYCLIEGEKENIYSTHSTCLILVPREISYDAYYINPHGRDMKDTVEFVRKITKRRTNTVNFKIPAELVFIRDLIAYWNTLHDYTENKINIRWDSGKMHTYYDTDLQAGDYWGTCFLFPLVLWHYMGEFYTKERVCEEGMGSFISRIRREFT